MLNSHLLLVENHSKMNKTYCCRSEFLGLPRGQLSIVLVSDCPLWIVKKTDYRASTARRDIAHNLSMYSCCSPSLANRPSSRLVLNQCLLYFSKIMERLAYRLHTMTSYLTLPIISLPVHCTEFTRNISLFLGKTSYHHNR